MADGTKLGIESDANDVHTVYYDIGSGWTASASATATDNTYQSAGYLGLSILNTTWRLDNFSGGTISVPGEPVVGQLAIIRTWGIPTGVGSKNRPGGWN